MILLLGAPLLLSEPAPAADKFVIPKAGLQSEEAAPAEAIEAEAEPLKPAEPAEPAEAAPRKRLERATPAPAEKIPREAAGRERRRAAETPAPAEQPDGEKPPAKATADQKLKPETPARPARPDKPERPDPDRLKRLDKPERPVHPSDPAPAPVDEVPAPPETEPEKQAETQVRETTREVERELGRRAARIQNPKEAQTVIDEILGAESRISRAEMAREERVRPRMEAAEGLRGPDRAPAASPQQRQEATTYFQRRLRGEAVDAPPELLRLSKARRARPQPPEERIEFRRPRYLRDGRRYVHFDSRATIPAILLAAEAMNYVQLQQIREVAPVLYEEVAGQREMPLPPASYRDESALVVSYPVDEASMITSDDILFLQGSTQFADPNSFEIVSALADAIKALPAKERFVIEGHASAEGDYDSNMALSQQRAERIVREMVRRGVSPYRLMPVGYGESEARQPAAAEEALRSQDRRVVVFRLRDQPLASR